MTKITYFFLMLVKVVSLLCERFRRDHQVGDRAFKILVVINIVKELVAEHLYLIFVHVWEHLQDGPSQ